MVSGSSPWGLRVRVLLMRSILSAATGQPPSVKGSWDEVGLAAVVLAAQDLAVPQLGGTSPAPGHDVVGLQAGGLPAAPPQRVLVLAAVTGLLQQSSLLGVAEQALRVSPAAAHALEGGQGEDAEGGDGEADEDDRVSVDGHDEGHSPPRGS